MNLRAHFEGTGIVAIIVNAGGKAPLVKLIDGEDLTWFGSRTAPAIARLVEFYDQMSQTSIIMMSKNTAPPWTSKFWSLNSLMSGR